MAGTILVLDDAERQREQIADVVVESAADAGGSLTAHLTVGDSSIRLTAAAAEVLASALRQVRFGG